MSSNKPFFAARLELWWDRRLEFALRRFGWRYRIIPYNGYASSVGARVLARVVLAPAWHQSNLGKAAEEFLRRRGWRNFITAPAVDHPYEIRFADAVVQGVTDRGGYIDHRFVDHGAAPGWGEASLVLPEGNEAGAPVLVVDDAARLGIVSDIDDTIMATSLPRPLIAAWNSFFRTEGVRAAVPGMAVLYRELLDAHPGAPIFYLSTGAWNTAPFLTRFLGRHRLPAGPMLLTDWGPTNTGWFRSGQQHKKTSLLQLAIDFPDLRWVLVGDDGQHDPVIYADFAKANLTRVEAILIRQLRPTEQWLAHGTLEPIAPPSAVDAADTPTFRAPDGRGLLRRLRDAGRLVRRR